MAEHYLSGAKWLLKSDKVTYKGVLGSDGSADLKNIAWGKYTFIVTKDGYEKQEDTIIVDDNPIDLQVELKPLPKKTRKTTKKTSEKKEGTSKKKKSSRKTSKKTEVKKEETSEEEKKN